ncbi:unnamed protein product [Tilletia controversa]|nr:unnamed protein product [Tilletia controversa]
MMTMLMTGEEGEAGEEEAAAAAEEAAEVEEAEDVATRMSGGMAEEEKETHRLEDVDQQERVAEDVDEPEAEPGAGGEEEVALRLDKDPLPQTRRGPHLRCVQEAQELERRHEAAVPVRHPARGRRGRPAAAAVVRRVAKMSAITAETLGTGHRNARIADGQDCADQAVDSSSAFSIRTYTHTLHFGTQNHKGIDIRWPAGR